MNKNICWIDDVNILTLYYEDLDSLLSNEPGEPVIFWRKENKYVEAAVGVRADDSVLNLTVSEKLPMGEDLILQWGGQDIPLHPRHIVRTAWFEQNCTAPEAELGAICKEECTCFAMWSPTATEVKVLVDGGAHLMNRQLNGVWTLKLNGDWHGCCYQFDVTIGGEQHVVNDPYAKSMLPNSESGVIIDFTRTDQIDRSDWIPPIETLQDAIIYELHIRDATIQKESGVLNRGKYLGLAETGTTTPNGSTTGMDYLQEIGCTHVQLLPVNDYARVDELHPDKQYNWGYDPLYFQALEGSYSVLPDRPTARVNELKTLIQTLHDKGMAVILDVVFNHVYKMEESSFEKLVPGYYFRYHTNGELSNGTGVGNDFASEKTMSRKFILDTVDLFLREYKVDGFRFDLMGAIDIETMRKISERCLQEPFPVMLLGEGWELDTALPPEQRATSLNAEGLPNIRFFNDRFRDTVKGPLFDDQGFGFVNGNGYFREKMPMMLTGSCLEEFGDPFVPEVSQTVNYVECHDNHTLWDRLHLTNEQTEESIRKKMHQLATGIVLLSQGIPFLHAGQEWFRSKKGDGNSYISGDDINQLDWMQREKEKENIEFVKSLISLRKNNPFFRLTSKREISRRFHMLQTPEPVIGFTLLGDVDDVSVYINPSADRHDILLPSAGNWKVHLSNITENASKPVNGEHSSIEGYELIIFQKARKPSATGRKIIHAEKQIPTA